MIKYRLRHENGRVIGPFTKDELFELKARGEISGKEEAQEYPAGNWLALEHFDFYQDLVEKNNSSQASPSSSKEETFVIDLSKIRMLQNEVEIESIKDQKLDQVELTETVRLGHSEPKIEVKKSEEVLPQKVEEKKGDEDKTQINPIAQQEIEKLRLAAIEAQIRQEEAEQKKKEEEERKAKELEAAKLKASDDSTQIITIDHLKTELLDNAVKEEKRLEKIQKKAKKKEELENQDEDEEERPSKKRKASPVIILVAAAILLYVWLFPDSDQPQRPTFQNLAPIIAFPIPFDNADSQRSKIEYEKGIEAFNKGTYPEIVKAGVHFKLSYENNLENQQSLNMMVRSYGEQIKYSKQKEIDNQTLFNLIRSKKPFLIQDPNGVIGLNLFYNSINKPSAAADVVAKYLKLNPKNVTQDLFAFYLKTLVDLGRIDTAKQFYTALDNAIDKNQYAYQALIDYLLLNQDIEKAKNYLDEAIKKYPKLVSFYLKKADLMLRENQTKGIEQLLKKPEELLLEYNDINRAKLLELQGLVFALNNKVPQAALYLKNSLSLVDSDELRLRLANLSHTSGSEEANQLIAESQAIKLLIQAKEFYEKKNYELALSSAARASDVIPGYVPAEIYLSNVQLKLGLASEALKTLEALKKKYPEDKEVNFALINAYIDTYKFNDAKILISNISTTKLRETYRFASANGKLFAKMGDSLQAISWFKNSISLNPFNDQDIFFLAEILIRKANFDAARVLLDQCMELDPNNPDYRIAYAKILYETQDDQAAIGYLLSILNEFGENPKVLGEIATFYYRAGKVKDFQDYKQKLEKLPVKDKAFYEFLIRSALLDERYDEIPGLVESLIQIEPGDLESMMTAGRVLFENGKLVEAAKWFKRVQDKLPTYPKVQYYIARILFLSKDFDKALEEVKKDMKDNGENDADLVLMAQIYVEKGDFVEAENLYKKAQKINSNSYDALVGLADLSTKRNNYELALDLYKKAMKLKSDEPIIHKKIGDVYRLLGQGSLAIESYKLYLEMDPDTPQKGQIESYIKIME
ncbi:MAG: tetratricopeptide repeat protein [Bacteriovoracaceae bacterium]